MNTKKLAEMTHEDFILKAIVALRKEGYKGAHVNFSGFNAAFREYFPGADPRAATEALAKEGKIVVRPCKGGALLYLPDDAPGDTGQSALAKMGL